MEDETKYIDDVIEHIESDIGKIQRKPNMYISYLGHQGALHLGKEIINNAIDECINQNSPADTIDVYLDETDNVFSVSDNGRGIPPESMVVVCTTLQSGSKFDRVDDNPSAGENGVGLTACNALADRFEIISYRDNKKMRVSFSRGVLTEPQSSISHKKDGKHGTTIVMQPSKFFMGEDCDIRSADLIDWLDKIVYLLPDGICINLSIKRRGKESLVTKKYVNKNGLSDYMLKLCERPMLGPIQFIKTTRATEIIRGKTFDRFIGLEVAFGYSSTNTELITDSFCNYVNTIDSGVHVDAVKQGILQYLTKMTKESLSDRDAKKLDITFPDAAQGLILTINLYTNLQPHFSGQTKQKVTNEEFYKPLRSLTYKALDEYFKVNQKDLKKATDKVRLNAKARIESNKVRNSVIRGETTNFDEHTMKNFAPANNRGKNDYRELIIIEGDSALGSARNGRFDNDTQAMFALRGVPLNAYGAKLDKVLLNAEFKTLVQLLGTNIGERFDISKLKYSKIIILTDSDSDGYNISSLLCAFFIAHMPQIVEGGYLYKAIAPLYRLKDKKGTFILNKQGYIKVHEKNIRDNLTIIDPTAHKVYDDEQLQDILMKNRDYLETLTRLSNHLAIDPIVLEFVIMNYGNSNINKKLKKAFPELSVDSDNILTGIHGGKFQLLVMDERFKFKIEDLQVYTDKINKGHMYFEVTEKSSHGPVDKGLMSLAEFLMLGQKYQPIIRTRYKGVGELNPEELRETTLDPNKRILVRLTTDDINAELAEFNILHGNAADERKQLMSKFKLNRDDLDN